MMFRSGKKFSREVSIYDPIGADKDGETVSLFDVLESGDREVLETVIIGQDVKILYEAYRERLTETEKKVFGCATACSGKMSTRSGRSPDSLEFPDPMYPGSRKRRLPACGRRSGYGE